MEVEGLDARARIEDGEGRCAVGGLLLEGRDDGVGLGVRGHADRGRVHIHCPGVEENGVFDANGIDDSLVKLVEWLW